MVQRSREITPMTAAEKAVESMLLELASPKPGNVSRYQDLSGLKFGQFLASISSFGRPIYRLASGRYSVGEGILECMERSKKAQDGGNTHLGTLILLAPLVSSASDSVFEDLRENLAEVLAGLAMGDGIAIQKAIQSVSPPLPDVRLHDAMTAPPEDFEHVTVVEWMSGGLAPDDIQNSIAREYVTNYELTFDVAWPELRSGLEVMDLEDAVADTFLRILSRREDTLILARHGREASKWASKRATEVLSDGGFRTDHGRHSASMFNEELVSRGYNPGTSADLVTSALYIELLDGLTI